MWIGKRIGIREKEKERKRGVYKIYMYIKNKL